LTFGECLRLANAHLIRVPTERLFALALRVLRAVQLSTIPPDVAPYVTSDTVMDTSRLERFLGYEYQNVIRFSVTDAFSECFRRSKMKARAMPAAKG
jgi:hypothetical protein